MEIFEVLRVKDKYFRKGDFMSAQLGHRPSYAWGSIFQARGVVEDGVLWRVGNGAKVRIWKDKWLLPPYSILSYSPHQRLDEDAKVCILMDSSTGAWNTYLI